MKKKTDSPLHPPRSAEGSGKSGVGPPYRIEGYTMWYHDSPAGFGCRRCSRPAEFKRVKYRRTKTGAKSYDVSGFCRMHLPVSAPPAFREAFTADLPEPARKRAPRKGSSGKRSAVQ